MPYPQELNDIPAIVAPQGDGADFADMIVDQFDEMLEQSAKQPLVMGMALHPYIVGQPHRLRHLEARAAPYRGARERIWLTTPGAIAQHCSLFLLALSLRRLLMFLSPARGRGWRGGYAHRLEPPLPASPPRGRGE